MNAVATMTLPERAATGAAFLDEDRPGWLDQVDVDRLDMRSPRDDVAGQVYGHFAVFLSQHSAVRDARRREEWDWTARHGFTLPLLDHRWGELTAAWRDLILARRAGGGQDG